MDTLELKDYGIKIGDGEKLVVMAGLNVLEDEGLAQEVCAELKGICADLDLPYIFKASWDKANRSSIKSYRGPGMEKGLPMLEAVKAKHGVPVVTDLHEPEQAEAVAEIAEVVQLPAFLVRQTDLVVATAAPLRQKAAGCMPKKHNSWRRGIAPILFQNRVKRHRMCKLFCAIAAPASAITILLSICSAFPK